MLFPFVPIYPPSCHATPCPSFIFSWQPDRFLCSKEHSQYKHRETLWSKQSQYDRGKKRPHNLSVVWKDVSQSPPHGSPSLLPLPSALIGKHWFACSPPPQKKVCKHFMHFKELLSTLGGFIYLYSQLEKLPLKWAFRV